MKRSRRLYWSGALAAAIVALYSYSGVAMYASLDAAPEGAGVWGPMAWLIGAVVFLLVSGALFVMGWRLKD
jgi:hypothetical protein